MLNKFMMFEDMHYLVTYPDNFDDSKKYPLLFLIHGAGTRGDDPRRLENNVFYTAIGEVEKFPFVVVAPLCSANTWFDIYEKLKRFVLSISKVEAKGNSELLETSNSEDILPLRPYKRFNLLRLKKVTFI